MVKSENNQLPVTQPPVPQKTKHSRWDFRYWSTEMWIQILGIIATILAAFFGAFCAGFFSESLWQKQVNYEQQNVAQALKIEILSMESDVDFVAEQFRADLVPRRFTPRPISGHFYSQNGLYFSFQPEIASFNPNLSTSLFIYYNDLIAAEELRDIVNEKSKIIDNHPEYTPRSIQSIKDIQDVQNSAFLKRFNIQDTTTRMMIWEGYDPNLTEDENVEIAQGRSANQRLKELIVNASIMQPIILNELDLEINK